MHLRGTGWIIWTCWLALLGTAAAESRLFIVELKDPSVVEQVAEWTAGRPREVRRAALQSFTTESYSRRLEGRQQALITTWKRTHSGVRVLDRRRHLLNILTVEARPEEIQAIQDLPEVRQVYPVEERYPLLDTVPTLVGAPALWRVLGGAGGVGIRIGIIDSGISHENPMFRGDGLRVPAGYPKGDAAFTNNKIIAARTYVREAFGLRSQPNKTPADEAGHGTRVASVAAGGESTANSPSAQLQGVAPFAYLGNYKVFGDPAINPTTTNAAIVAAIDEAVADGMDVINLSLGSTARDPRTDPEQRAIERAVRDAGVVVVVAAGNSGPEPGTINTPGTSPAAITVGATSNGRIFASALETTSSKTPPPSLQTIAYVPGERVFIGEAIGPHPLQPILKWDSSELACNPLPEGSLSGKIALVRRGNCFFINKVENVRAAGALALVVYNDEEGASFTMGFSGQTPALPAVMIEKGPGEQLRDFAQANSNTQIKIRSSRDLARFPARSDLITGFSSRGPNIDTAIKPDLVAPGQNIYTASLSGNFALGANGTSFSAPIVSGAAALILQLHPEWRDQLSPELLSKAVKSALVNTAGKNVTWDSKVARVMQSGNGMLDLEAAMRATAMLDPVSLSFGRVSEEDGQFPPQTISLRNVAKKARRFAIQVIRTYDNSSVDIRVQPQSLELAPGQEEVLTVEVSPISRLRGGAFEGYLRIRDLDSETDLTASFWGAVTLRDSRLLEVSQTGSAEFSSLAAAVRAAKPGNIVEIIDSASYSTSLRIQFNDEGLPLHGITIRSRAGQLPTLDARQVTSSAPLIDIVKLEDVTIQGLRLKGGLQAIRMQDSSGVIRDNIISDTPLVSGSHGIELLNSSAHVYKNSFESIGGKGVGLAGSRALVQKNVVGGAEPGQGTQDNAIHVSVGSRLALFDNLIRHSGSSEGSGAQGVRVSSALALLKGNRILGRRGSEGDGVFVRGGLSSALILDNWIERNSRRGVHIEADARVDLERNLILDNSQAGLFVSSNASAKLRSSFLVRNGRGVDVNGSVVGIFNSVIADSAEAGGGEGILAEGGRLDISNATIYKNAGAGVSLNGTSGTLTNSILFQNRQDLVKPASATVTDNLVGTDPVFSNPADLDYSPRDGSPAIDRGTDLNRAGPVDLLSHQRVAGERIDLGAVEHGSRFAPPLILPILSTRGEDFVALAVANATRNSAVVILRGYDPDGTPWKDSGGRPLEHHLEVGGESQTSLILTEAFGPLRAGWIEILSTRPDVTSFTLLGNNAFNRVDGTELSTAISSRLVFPEIFGGSGESTWFHLVNPHPEPTPISLDWIYPGQAARTVDKVLPGRGALSLNFGELFGSGTGGYVIVNAKNQKAIYGLEIFDWAETRGGLLALDATKTSSDLLGAQLASIGNVETFINLINLGQSPATITLQAVEENGRVLDTQILPLGAGEQLRAPARNIFRYPVQSVVGWLRVTSGSDQLQGSLRFGSDNGSFLASLPLRQSGAREFLLSHVGETELFFTGLTLLNASSQTALVSVEVFKQDGSLSGVSLLKLRPDNKLARLVSELIPDLTRQAGGFVRVRSSSPIVGFQIFGDYSGSFLSAVPQQVVVP